MAILHFLSRKNPILSVDKCYPKDASDELFGFVLDADGMGQLDMAIFWWLPVQPFMVHLLNPASCTALHGSEWNLLGGIEVVGIFHTHLGSFSCVSVYHKEGPKNGNPIIKICRPQFLIFLLYGKRPVDCDPKLEHRSTMPAWL